VFTGFFQLRDTFVGSATNFNWYGYAKWNLSMGTYPFRWEYASTVFIQGDSLVNTGAIAIAHNVTSGFSNITFDFNSMESTQTVGNGFAFSWRNNCNAFVNVKKYIKSPHSQQFLQTNHSGKIVINCPRNIMTATNVYGGNFKQVIYGVATTATSEVIVNGDMINESAYLGGLNTMVRWEGLGILTCNGKIEANASVGVWSTNGSPGMVILKGDLSSSINTIVTQGNALVIAKNITISCSSNSNNSIYMYSGTLYMMGCSLYFSLIDGTMIGLDAGGTTNLEVINCVSKSEGAVGTFVTSPVAKTCQFTNTLANKPLNVNVTNQLAQGFIVEPLLEVLRY
jgi:hypothetical protein